MQLKELIEAVYSQGGSEIHLKAGSPPLIRQNRFLRRVEQDPLKAADMKKILKDLLDDEDRKKFAANQYLERNFFGVAPCNYRLILFQAQEETFAIVKIIRKAVPSFGEILFPQTLGEIIHASKGIFILAGPARSGISTSLAALVEHINQNRACHILIMEDPIEFAFEPKKSRVSQRQFKKDLLSIDQGINFAKRMDVDVMVIGDLKQEVPYRSLLDYVDGGHFVILSMQTLGIQNTLEKIIFSFPEADRDHACNVLAHNLIGVCSQALLLDSTGRNLVPIHEVLQVNNTIRGIVQKGRINQIEPNIRSAGTGSATFDDSISRAIGQGNLSRESASAFQDMYRGMRS